jgi:four helix bundle suffix protein
LPACWISAKLARKKSQADRKGLQPDFPEGQAEPPVVPYIAYKTYIEGSAPEVAANAMLCPIHQTNFLLDQQLRQLEKKFLEKGRFTEKLYRTRQKARSRS